MEWSDFARSLIGTWPTAKWDQDLIAAYVSEIQARGVTADEAIGAVRSSSSDFVLSAGALAAAVERERQGPAPGWLEAHRMIATRISRLPYHDPEAGMEALVERLTREGHEAVARFVARLSARELRELPDPAREQNYGGSQALGRAEREYREVVKNWEADPRLGLALEDERAAPRLSARRGSGGMAGVVAGLEPARQIEEKT
jgi:hypothetical protein